MSRRSRHTEIETDYRTKLTRPVVNLNADNRDSALRTLHYYLRYLLYFCPTPTPPYAHAPTPTLYTLNYAPPTTAPTIRSPSTPTTSVRRRLSAT